MATVAKKAETQTKDLTPRQVAINKARAEANAETLENHKKERDALIQAKVKEAGFEWTPQLTPAEKAEAQIRKLLAETPELAGKFAEVQNAEA